MAESQSSKIISGIDSIISDFEKIEKYKKIGLISNSRATGAGGHANLFLLKKAGAGISAVFSPEHGYFANIKDGEYIGDGTHPELNIPIFSLFTENHSKNAIIENAEAFALDLLIFDIQDVGVRFYTYIHALGMALAGAEALGIPILVLDRPNPVSCAITEGNIPKDEFISELCPYKIPARYGLTIGELALFLKNTIYKNAPLEVVKIKNYRRGMFFSDTGLEWHAPSPAMISPDTAIFYPGTCFFEGTNLSEGRGTKEPFQIIGAPFLNAPAVIEAVSDQLKKPEFAGISIIPMEFTPSSSKYENVKCSGIKLETSDKNIKSLLFGFILVKIMRDLHADKFEFLFSLKSGHFFIDRLFGGSELRDAICSGGVNEVVNLYKNFESGIDAFNKAAAPSKLYL